ncbi:MAG: ATP-dependent Clp protease ATP-binding subunit [Bdellovibrionales bacterium]|nr:ATP-dependent Clp protease ATP-binding subunit [Bdellovibrionales bacterium]
MIRALVLMLLVLSLTTPGPSATVCWSRYEGVEHTVSHFKGSTVEVRDLLEVSVQVAQATGAHEVSPIHILAAAVTGKAVDGQNLAKGTIGKILTEAGLLNEFTQTILDNLPGHLETSGGTIVVQQGNQPLSLSQVRISEATENLLKKANEVKELENSNSGNPNFMNNYISAEHLLLATLQTPGPIRDFLVSRLGGTSMLAKIGFDGGQVKTAKEALEKLIRQIRGNGKGSFGATDADASSHYERVEYKSEFEQGRDNEIVFTENLNKRAERGELQRVVLREKEVAEALNALAARRRNSVNIVGDVGVGRESLVYGIIQVLNAVKANPDSPLAYLVPKSLRNLQILEFDASIIQAGTKYRGTLDENVQQLMKQLKGCNGDCVLYVRDLEHLEVAGATGEGGGSGVGQQLIRELVLANGNPKLGLRIIGTTTTKGNVGFRTSTLGKFFHEVKLEAPDKEITTQILALHLQEESLAFPILSTASLESVASKAVEIMESYPSIGDRLFGSLKLIKEALLVKETMLRKQDPTKFAEYSKLKDEASDILSMVSEGKMTPEEANAIIQPKIDALKIDMGPREVVLAAVSILKGAPVANIISQSTRMKLAELEAIVRKTVIGNESLVSRLTKAIIASHMRARSGKDPRPLLTYGIFGPSGNGKSTLVKAIAEALGIPFDTIDGATATERSIIGEDSSFAMEKSKQDHLVAKVRNQPYRILYFNEANLSNPKIFELLEKILEDGKLTDRAGNTATFENTIVIIDGNVAVSELRALGISEGKEPTNEQVDIMRELAKPEAEREFPEGSVSFTPEAAEIMREALVRGMGNRPALLGRIEYIDYLGYLGPKQLEGIAELLLRDVNNSQIKDKGYPIEHSPEVTKLLADFGMQPQNRELGARPLRSMIKTVVDPVLSDIALNPRYWNEFSEFTGKIKVVIEVQNNTLVARIVDVTEKEANAAE